MFQPLSVQVTNKYLSLDKNESGYTSKIRFFQEWVTQSFVFHPTTKSEKLLNRNNFVQAELAYSFVLPLTYSAS